MIKTTLKIPLATLLYSLNPRGKLFVRVSKLDALGGSNGAIFLACLGTEEWHVLIALVFFVEG